jgi:hypothetical protein
MMTSPRTITLTGVNYRGLTLVKARRADHNYHPPTSEHPTRLIAGGGVSMRRGGPDGKRMRCQFHLLRADEGMKGGGEGQCQPSSGQNIRADFSPS